MDPGMLKSSVLFECVPHLHGLIIMQIQCTTIMQMTNKRGEKVPGVIWLCSHISSSSRLQIWLCWPGDSGDCPQLLFFGRESIVQSHIPKKVLLNGPNLYTLLVDNKYFLNENIQYCQSRKARSQPLNFVKYRIFGCTDGVPIEVDQPTDRPIDRPTDPIWPDPTDRQTDIQTDWLIDYYCNASNFSKHLAIFSTNIPTYMSGALSWFSWANDIYSWKYGYYHVNTPWNGDKSK